MEDYGEQLKIVREYVGMERASIEQQQAFLDALSQLMREDNYKGRNALAEMIINEKIEVITALDRLSTRKEGEPASYPDNQEKILQRADALCALLETMVEATRNEMICKPYPALRAVVDSRPIGLPPIPAL